MKYSEAASLETTKTATLDNKKKTVLLLGDSIRIGYCEKAKAILCDKADVVYPDDNCRYTQYTYTNLAVWRNLFSDPSKVDVVCWNNGHWDIAHWENDSIPLNSIPVYCEMLLRIADRLKAFFPNAKIVFQTTLPMNPSSPDWINHRSTAEIIEYNKAAVATLKDIVFIDDTFSLFENSGSEAFIDFCHLTDESNDYLAKHISDYIMGLF